MQRHVRGVVKSSENSDADVPVVAVAPTTTEAVPVFDQLHDHARGLPDGHASEGAIVEWR